MTSASKSINGNDDSVSSRVMSGMRDEMHASASLWLTKGSKPLNVHEWVRIQAELRG
jgi:hypothetical protein